MDHKWKNEVQLISKLRCSYKSFVKNGKDTRTHHENIPATAYYCWQVGGVEREAKLSLWAEFWPFLWEDHCC